MLPTSKKIRVTWFVYIILCDDGSLYTGITTNLQDRLVKHRTGKGARYTRSHGAKQVVFSERHSTRSKALVREAEIKKLSRKEKVKLVNISSK